MTNIVCWGDSLTFGTNSTDPATLSYPSQLANLLPGQTVSNQGVPGESSSQIETRMVADSAHVNDIAILWAGHNDASPFSSVASNIAAMVSHLGSNTKFLVLSTISRTYQYVGGPGDSEYTALLAMNAVLASTYGTKYVDVMGMLKGNGNPTDATDISDTALGRIPGSLQNLADTIHLFDGGYALVAKQLARVIWAKGWATTTLAIRDVVSTPSRATDEVLVAFDETGEPLPRNVLVRSAATLRSNYGSAGYFFGQRATLDVQAGTAARALI